MKNVKEQSVSQLVFGIKGLLEGEFKEILVTGEISNLSLSASGHWYFSLSDQNSTISVALFKGDALRNPIIRKLKNGDKITLFGNLSVYAKRGNFQIIAKQLIAKGKGDLKEEFERLKAKLHSEGYFDEEHKKTIPRFPEKIAIVTSPSAAALQDFLEVFLRRSFACHLVLVPAVVQGDAAANSMIEALDKIEKVGGFDLVVLTRGGGSMEDLWAFNDENLVKRIFKFKIPLISAVGHQIDFTLSDFVSDSRSETPTAAAQDITQAQTQIKKEIQSMAQRLNSSLKGMLLDVSEQIESFHPAKLLESLRTRISNYSSRLDRLALEKRAQSLLGLEQLQLRLDDQLAQLIESMEKQVEDKDKQNEQLFSLVKALDPTSILSRGYSIMKDDLGAIINSKENFESLKSDSKLKVQFYDGEAYVKKP